MKVISELLTTTFNFSLSILIFLTSLSPWLLMTLSFLKFSLVQSFMTLSLPWLHWLFQFWLNVPHRKGTSSSLESRGLGHLLLTDSHGIHILSYTFHHFLYANGSQVCISNHSLSFNFTFPALHWRTYVHSCTAQQSWAHISQVSLPCLTFFMVSVPRLASSVIFKFSLSSSSHFSVRFCIPDIFTV